MGRPREQYAIKEFREAREALDGYYSSLNWLAMQIKRHATLSEIDMDRQKMRVARERLGKAIEGLGFTLADEEERH